MAEDESHQRGVRWGNLWALLALAAIVAALLAPPHALLDKADRAAYAVCARIPGHVFEIAGRPLPLCARCTGTYLGALAGLVVLTLRGRGRAGKLPTTPYSIILGAFVLAWAGDGVNSYVGLFTGRSPLYEPSNLLRLTTGTLEGLAIAAILLPVLNLSLWAAPEPRPSVGAWPDLAWMLAGGALVIGLVGSGQEILLHPLALASGAMVIALISAVNIMLVLITLHRDGRARRWQEVLTPGLVGIALALGELAAIGAARVALTERLGLPF